MLAAIKASFLLNLGTAALAGAARQLAHLHYAASAGTHPLHRGPYGPRPAGLYHLLHPMSQPVPAEPTLGRHASNGSSDADEDTSDSDGESSTSDDGSMTSFASTDAEGGAVDNNDYYISYTGAGGSQVCIPLPRSITLLPLTADTDMPAEDTCCICMDNYRAGDLVACLACGHAVHSLCFAKMWVRRRSDTCPICRGPITDTPPD